MFLRNFEIFSVISSFRYLLWTIKRHFNIISKNSQQIMDSFQSIFSNKWIAAEWRDFENWKLFLSQHNMYVISIQNFGCNFSELVFRSKFGGNWLEWIHAHAAVFGTNIEMSLYDLMHVPKLRFFVEFFFIISQQQFFFQ